MKVTSVKGTNDYLPSEVELRDYLQNTILNIYKENGFEHIVTPAIEDMENLDKSDGGENLNLIFEILKRGDKLTKAINNAVASGDAPAHYKELCDLGLRYDLTLPLSRYYANNKEKLTLPAKFIQMDRVYRAERPQKGRLREFVQCDIDIIGSESNDSEVELILTTTKALDAIGMKNYKVKINDRRILRNCLKGFGFKEEDLDSVCITLDKIGSSGVAEELKAKSFDETAVEKFVAFLEKGDYSLDYVKTLVEDKAPIESVETIIAHVDKLKKIDFDIVFDLSLVRGQGYYTGTVFEVESIDFKGAIAGGGRYDNLIGKFLNQDIPAVGFSIGFERIYTILMEHGTELECRAKRMAVMYEEGNVEGAYAAAEKVRAKGIAASIFVKPKKLGKFLDKLANEGYTGFVDVEKETEKEF